MSVRSARRSCWRLSPSSSANGTARWRRCRLSRPAPRLDDPARRQDRDTRRHKFSMINGTPLAPRVPLQGRRQQLLPHARPRPTAPTGCISRLCAVGAGQLVLVYWGGGQITASAQWETHRCHRRGWREAAAGSRTRHRAAATMMDTSAFSRNPYAQTLKKLSQVPKLSLDEVQTLIRRKIGQMTAKDTDQLRHGA